jgi:hypothetical protein
MAVLLGLRGLDIQQAAIGSWGWWLSRPLLFAVLAVVTAVLVAVFVRFDRGTRSAGTASVGTASVSAGSVGSGSVGSGSVATASVATGSDEPRRWVDPVAAVSAGVLFFGILIVSIVGVDVLGNRAVFFLVGDVAPVVGFSVVVVGLLLLRATRPRPAPTAVA